LVSIIIGRIIEYFIHESGHFATAWMMGITMTPDPMQAIITTPIHITRYQTGIYGFSESFQYIPYMSGLDVSSASMTAIGGLMFNALAAVLCFWIFLKSRGIKYKSLMTLSLWVLIFNLGALFSYIPMWVFEVTGDVGFFLSLSLFIRDIPLSNPHSYRCRTDYLFFSHTAALLPLNTSKK
jgi:hypothetical protein